MNILAQISLLANLVNELLNPNASFGMFTHLSNSIKRVFPTKIDFWSFFNNLKKLDHLTRTQLDFLLNALIYSFKEQDCMSGTDEEKMGDLSPETVKALERLLKAGAKPFQLILEYVVVQMGNAHVLWILCQNNALDDSNTSKLCDFIHVWRPWEYSQFEVLVVLFMYGKALNIQDSLRSLFGRFLTEGTVGNNQYGATVGYVELLIFGSPKRNINGLKIPKGVKIADEWIPLLKQRNNCRESTFTLLGILRKRPDAVPSNAVPRDIARIISQNVWNSRNQDAWNQASRPSQTSNKKRKM